MQDTNISYDAPATIARFMSSTAFVRIIAGPVGSGKTTGCMFELLRRSIEQTPGEDGIRHTRWAIVRQTLKQLKDTVLKDITSWLEGICTYKVSDNTVYVEFGDVKSEWLLIPLDNPEDQARLLSMQLTGAWMSELIEMNTGIMAPLLGRIGRYPSGKLGSPKWSGCIADTNMPTQGSPWHNKMSLAPPPDWEVFVQPGGLDEDAENLPWLNQTDETLKLPMDHPDRLARGRLYYERLANNNPPDWVTRYVHAQYGSDPSGSAVFRTTFKHSFHVVENLEPVAGYPLIVGQDFGRNPCAVVAQPDHKGRLLILDEIVAEDMGLEVHITTNLRPKLSQERYITRRGMIVGDPSGAQRSSLYEENSFNMLADHGYAAYPAPTNDLEMRLRAVEKLFMRQIDGGPAILIDESRCPYLINALNGMYRFAKRRDGELRSLPDKGHPWSDLADALQYICLVYATGYSNYIMRNIERRAARHQQNAAPPFSSAAWT